MNKIKINPNVYLFFILIAGFIIRLIRIPSAVMDNHVIFSDPDDYYHMRRIYSFLEKGFINNIDLFRGIDYQNVCIWTPYYDYFYGFIIKFFTIFFHSNQFNYEIIASLIPPFFSLLSGFMFFLLLKKNGINFALVSTLIFVLSPLNINVSNFGSIDHHSFEILSFIISIYFLSNFIDKEPTVFDKFGFSFSIVLMFLIWGGSSLYITLLVVIIIMVSLFHKIKLEIIGKCFFYSSLILFPLYTYSSELNNYVIAYDRPSLFQPLLLLICSSIFYNSSFISGNTSSDRFNSLLTIKIYNKKISLILLIPLLLLLIPITYQLWQGFSFLILKNGGYKFTKFIAETQPLFSQGFLKINNMFSPFFFISPFICILMLNSLRKKTDKIFLIISTGYILSLLLMLSNQRYGYIFIIFFIPLVTYGISELSNGFSYEKRNIFYFLSSLLIIVSILPSIKNSITSRILLDSFSQTLLWIKNNTEKSYDNFSLKKDPNYTVMSIWDKGHMIMYLSERAVTSDNFGHNPELPVNFMIQNDESNSVKIFKNNLSRYILLSPGLINNPYNNILILGDKTKKWVTIETFQEPDGSEGLYFYPGKDFINSIYSRMYLQDSVEFPEIDQKGLSNYRLVYETSENIPVQVFKSNEKGFPFFMYSGKSNNPIFKPLISKISRYKVFELVKGAVIETKTLPETDVIIQGVVETNTKRKFVYRKYTKSDKYGLIKVTLPYGLKNKPESTGLTSKYILIINKNKVSLNISDKDVIEGKKIKI